MTDTPTTPAPDAIDPADAELEASIRNFDPVYDTPGPVTCNKFIRPPERFSVDMLGTDAKDRVREKLKAVPLDKRTDAEHTFVHEELEANSYRLRALAGPGDGATAYAKEQFELVREKHDLQRDLWALETDLAEIDGFKHETDPATGLPVPVAILKYQGERRRGMEDRRAWLVSGLAQLEGREGQERLTRAMAQSVADAKALAEERAILADADKLADAKVRAARVEKLADAKARMRTTLN